MEENVTGTLWRLAFYIVVSLIGTFALVAVFGQLRFQSEKTYKAQFANVSGMETGNFVRIAGVECGKVNKTVLDADPTLLVEFSVGAFVVLTEGTRAAIRFADLTGGRYM